MKRTLTAIVAIVGLASGANAASLTIDSDSATYTIGQTITITATLDTTGAITGVAANQAVDTSITWIDALATALNSTVTFTMGSSSQIITAGLNVGASNLTSFGGGAPWTGPPQSACAQAGPTAGMLCIILNQSQFIGPFANPDAATLVGTLELQADAVGALGLGVTGNAFGLTPVLGSNFQNATIVPEPTTAALLALGLVGLAAAGRRR